MTLAKSLKSTLYELAVGSLVIAALALLASPQAFAVTKCDSSVELAPPAPQGARTLRVVLYPFLPNFAAYKNWVVTQFESTHSDIHLQIVDLTNNYYGSFTDDYVGCANADVYELDSVFLYDFALNKKIQPLPKDATIPNDQFLKNAVAGSTVNGIRYGSPHWVCGNFMFFAVDSQTKQFIEEVERVGAAPVSMISTRFDFRSIIDRRAW